MLYPGAKSVDVSAFVDDELVDPAAAVRSEKRAADSGHNESNPTFRGRIEQEFIAIALGKRL